MIVEGECEGCDDFDNALIIPHFGCLTGGKQNEALKAGVDCWHPIGTALVWNEEITEIAHGIVCVSPSTTTGCGL